MQPDKAAESLSVPSEDPKKEEKPLKGEPPKPTSRHDGKEEELSEEDIALKGELEMLVERLKESDTSLYRPALESLRTLIRTSTSSMTSVPKPLKFLRPHYPDLQTVYENWLSSSTTNANSSGISDKSLFADILSVLAMTYSDEGRRETLAYRLRGGSEEDPGVWGHEYVRHLAAEIGEEYQALQEQQEDQQDESGAKRKTQPEELLDLAKRLIPFLLSHNGESDACDLLMEIESIRTIIPLVSPDTFERVGLYLISCVNYLPQEEDLEVMKTAREIYLNQGRFMEALTLSIKLGDRELMEQDFAAPSNPVMKRQLAHLLARQRIPLEIDDDEFLTDILNNTKLSEDYKTFAKELSALEAKIPEDIYKSHLENSTRSNAAARVDSARANLADTFVNAFVNVGFGNDKLMVEAEEGQSWIYKNKDEGMFSAAASLGLICLWDPDVGMGHIDRYTYSDNDYIKAGATLANGLLHSGMRSENDAALAVLGQDLEHQNTSTRVSAIIGLGIAYAGSTRADVTELILPSLADSSLSIQISSAAALAAGFVNVGSCNGEVAETILQALMEREESELSSEWTRFMGLGLALLYLGRQDASDATLETLKAISAPIGKQARVLVESCSFSGTGNVLKIQQMLHYCTDHIVAEEENKNEDEDENNDGRGGGGGDGDTAMGGTGSGSGAAEGVNDAGTGGETSESAGSKEKEDDLFQALAVIGLALVGMGEDIGSEMLCRQFNHLMHYGEAVIRRTVPLALGFISVSNPALHIMDTLSKYSHDNDLDVAINAIFAMGLLGSGTNNARLAQMLRQLASYYATQPDALFVVRIAQGMIHMGKGTVTINPFHTDRVLMSPVAVCGLLTTLISFTDVKDFILGQYPWMLYHLVMAMYPRFLITVDEEGNHKPVSVRVGQAVEIVGQAGRPRSITGFQTHTTPVRLAHTERAELATEEFIPYAPVCEGYVILRKNPGWEEES